VIREADMHEEIETLVALFEQKRLSRRQLIGALVAATAARAQRAGAAPSLFEGQALNHVTMMVGDVERSRAFYERLLGVTVMYDGSRVGQPMYDMKLNGGTSFISVVSARSAAPRIDHFCVGIPNFDTDRAEALIKEQFPNAQARATSTPPGASEPIQWRSVNLKDPDGNGVQLGDVKFQLNGKH
jgi:catechol 2,3-dioxygenase-like lactoylglutathione lyase family enzyme